MSFTYLDPYDTFQIQKVIVDWINSNLKDPYSITGRGSRNKFAVDDDYKNHSTFPIVQVKIIDFNSEKITKYSGADYLEEEEHNFMIYYICKKGQAYNFKDYDNKTKQDIEIKLSGEQQAIKYLQYIRNSFKKNIENFKQYFSRPTLGKIARPIYNKNTSLYISSFPLTVYTYRR